VCWIVLLAAIVVVAGRLYQVRDRPDERTAVYTTLGLAFLGWIGWWVIPLFAMEQVFSLLIPGFQFVSPGRDFTAVGWILMTSSPLGIGLGALCAHWTQTGRWPVRVHRLAIAAAGLLLVPSLLVLTWTWPMVS
jgi:hypothetical protein